jgi:sulfatase maturation enzyme AslB (radical SAM superfamily)
MSMNNKFTVSINPTYYCNFRCDFCYLTEEQLSDTTKITPEKLDNLLSQIPEISHIDLYGGEIGTLKADYFYKLKETIRKYYHEEINIVTNLSMTHDWFYDEDIHLTVSYDWEAREKHNKVFENMLLSPVPISVLILATTKILDKDVDEMITELNMCSNVISVEIKPYSTNQANCHQVTDEDYENFVKRFMTSPVKKNFQFVNQDYLEDVITNTRNAFSDDHVYITPEGTFAVLEFDLNNNEYFHQVETFDEYVEWTQKEKKHNVSDVCKECEYFGKCLTEHYRYVKTKEQSCNGYYKLIKWYENL